MQKKILSLTLCVALLVVCVVGMAACNKSESDAPEAPSAFVMPVGSRPAYASLFSDEDLALIERVVAAGEDADYFDKQDAVMALFNTANKSRIETPKSLVVQESFANAKGIAAAMNANILMHSFNLRNGEKWYYQLATSVDTGDSLGNSLITEFAGYLKVGYCLGTDDNGDGEIDYYYFGDIGAEYNCDCSVTTFPYATFAFPKGLKPFEKSMTLEQFNDKLNVLNEIHEINNMDFTASIIGEDAKVTYEDGVYKAEFSVDMEANKELLEKWFAMPKKDMAVGDQTLTGYNYYRATLEVWNNGYAKYFESSADREAGMGSGSPVDKYSYLWDETEIVNLVCTDTNIAEYNANAEDEDKIDDIDDCIAFYTNHDNFKFVAKKLGIFEIVGIVAGCVVAVIIAIVVTVEVLVKQGKLPKLAKRRADKKAKRLARKKGGANDDASTQPASASNDINRESKFTAGLWSLIGLNLSNYLIAIFTLGLGIPYVICRKYKWLYKNQVIDGRRLVFEGTAGSLFGQWIKWVLLGFVTFGIYFLWLPIKKQKWITEHTHFEQISQNNTSSDNVNIVNAGPADGISYGEDVIVSRNDGPVDEAFGYPPKQVYTEDSEADNNADE